jgi:hypothetical protein
MVITCQVMEGGLGYGSGSIVHSSAERGTWVLTALHCVPHRLEPAWVWWIGPSGEELIDAEVVWPKQIEQEATPTNEWISDEFMLFLTMLAGDDFAFMKLKDARIFPIVPLEAPGTPEFEDGTRLELIAIAPDLVPHRFAWTWTWGEGDSGAFREGHSGSAVLRNGALTGLISHVFASNRSATTSSVPRLSRMREVVKGTPLEPILSR